MTKKVMKRESGPVDKMQLPMFVDEERQRRGACRVCRL